MHRRLLLLNGLAVLGVVLNHATGWGFTAMFWWTDRYLPVAVPDYDQVGSASYFALRFVEQLVAFTVPAFLVVSGFFISFAIGRSRETAPWRVVGSRVKTLIIPYLIWSTVIVAWRILEGAQYSADQLVRTYVFGRAALPYYYIPLLIQLYLLAPLFIILARKNWVLLLGGAALVQLAFQARYYVRVLDLSPEWLAAASRSSLAWFFPTKVFWFVLGIVLWSRLSEFRDWLGRTRRSWLIASLILLPLGMWETEALMAASGQEWIVYSDTVVDSLYALAFIFAFLAFDTIMPPLAERISELGTRSYGVYLVHSPAQELAARAVAVLLPALLAYQILFQPVLIAAGLGIPLLLMYLVDHSPARRYYRFLFG